MISEGSCDTEDWVAAKNVALPSFIHYFVKL